MSRLLTIAATACGGTLFAWGIPLSRIFSTIQPLTTALSIMIAAILVRLNRGMPSLEWKSIKPEERAKLTGRILNLSREYGWIVALYAGALLALVSLSTIGKDDASMWPGWLQQTVAGSMGAVGGLCIARMVYVVWRDIDVVRLQKVAIDGLAETEFGSEQAAAAAEKVTNIRSANIRRVEIAPPKAWGE